MHRLIIGCGYLGERAAALWRAGGDEVTVLTRSAERAVAFERQGMRAVLGDVMAPESLAGLPAAETCLYAVGFDRRGAHDKRAVSVEGLRNALKVLQRRVPRLVFVSSTSVYGQDGGEIVNEDSPCAPTAENGRVCLDSERVVREFYPDSSADRSAVIVRLAGIYGPGRLIGRVDQLRAGRPLSGHPQAWLNLVHVDDAAQGAVQIADRTDLTGTWLLSDERPLRRQEFYKALAQAAGAPAPTFDGTGELGLNKRCDSARLRARLGLRLVHPEALAELGSLVQAFDPR